MIIIADFGNLCWVKADTERYDFMLEPVFGEPTYLGTLGGYLIRHGMRTMLVDTRIGPTAKHPFAG
jgi:hypothetical protein